MLNARTASELKIIAASLALNETHARQYAERSADILLRSATGAAREQIAARLGALGLPTVPRFL